MKKEYVRCNKKQEEIKRIEIDDEYEIKSMVTTWDKYDYPIINDKTIFIKTYSNETKEYEHTYRFWKDYRLNEYYNI